MNRTILVTMLAIAACKGKKEDSHDKNAGNAKPGEAPSAGKATPPDALDAELAAAAKKVGAECKDAWLADKGYYESSKCPAMTKEWYDAIRKIPSFKDGAKYANTLLGLVEDKNPGIRYLATSTIYQKAGEWMAEDKAMQERVFAVAESLDKNAVGGVANELGCMIGFFHLDKTGLFDRAKALVAKEAAPEALRVGIVNWLLAGNAASEPAYALVRDQAKTGSPAIKAAALVGLSGAYNSHATDEMCKLWVEALPTLADNGRSAPSLVAAHVTNGDLQIFNENDAFPWNWAMVHSKDNKCPPATVDAALAWLEKQVTEGNAGGVSTWFVAALSGPAKSKNATPEQKKKAAEIAQKYLENEKYGAYERGNSLEALVTLDPALAKTLADKYINDKDDSLKNAAKRALDKLK